MREEHGPPPLNEEYEQAQRETQAYMDLVERRLNDLVQRHLARDIEAALESGGANRALKKALAQLLRSGSLDEIIRGELRGVLARVGGKSRPAAGRNWQSFALGGIGTVPQKVADFDLGLVDPRLAAEAVALTFLQCTLKGLQRSPRLVTDPDAMREAGVFTAADISCLVIPDKCVGLPTLAALEQGIPVIAVAENDNLMQNDLRALPWAPGQLHMVENYWEACGVMTALKAGIAPDSLRRPLAATRLETANLATPDEKPGAARRSVQS